MQLALRPYVTTGIVIAGASALVAAPLTIAPSALDQPTVAIAPTASALDGALHDFDTLFTNGGNSAQVLLTQGGALPAELSRAFLAAIDDPHVLPSLGSAFLYGLLNPTPDSHSVLADLAKQLPSPLGPTSATDIGILLNAFRALGAIVAHSLPGLPSPVEGSEAMAAVQLPHVVDVVTKDLGIAGAKFGEQAAFTAAFIGDLPNDVVHFLHAAAANPEDLPTLLTNTALTEMTDLGDAVFGPMVCLLEDTMPAPFGGPQGLVVKAVQQFLAVMPQPEASADLVADTNETTPTTLGGQDTVQRHQNLGGATGPLGVLNQADGDDHEPPVLVKKNDVDSNSDSRTGPRLNVLKVNPLADPRGGSTDAGNGLTGSTAKQRPLLHVVQKLAQAPATIAHSIRDALKPHNDQESGEPQSGDE